MTEDLGFSASVVWTRGPGCRELAELIATAEASKAEGDLATWCLTSRADLVVTRDLSALPVLPAAAPRGLRADDTGIVLAAVGSGPHSRLAAKLAAHVADRLGVDAMAASVYRTARGRADAEAAIESIADLPITSRAIEADGAAGFIGLLPSDALLVLGAAGGWWLYRQFLGTGARLTAAAPGGTIVVRSAPRCAFHLMDEPEGFSPHLSVADALQLSFRPVEPVVHHGNLLGIVRWSSLRTASPGAEVGDVMEDPAFVGPFDPLSDVADVADFFEGAPVPIVDSRGRLLGLVPPERLPQAPATPH